MKPSFALDFRDGAIALLHRTSRGWQQVGATTLDAPDLTEALAYMRSTALGLSPRGLATKLVLPNDQILLTTVHAPGPDAARRRKQIRAALEGLTPYQVDELAFDWSGSGSEVRVAVVARETLAEAETFAVEHRFNPVSFVAAPEDASFQGEPHFGPTALSETLLAPGEKVERDQDAIVVVTRDLGRGEPVAAALAATADPAPAPAPASASALEEALESAPPSLKTEPEPATAPAVTAATFPPIVSEAAPEPQPEPAPAPLTEPATDTPGALLSAAVTATAAEPEAPPPPPEEEPDPAPHLRDEVSLPDFASTRVPPEGPSSFDMKDIAVDLVEEAPMALDVASEGKDAPAPDHPPLSTPVAAAPDADLPLPPRPAPSILAAFGGRRTAEPPAPKPSLNQAAQGQDAAPTDFVKAAAEARARKAPPVGPAPAQRPSVPRPNLAKPAGTAPAGRDTLSFPGRNPAKPTVGKPGPASQARSSLKLDRNVVPLAKSASAATTEATSRAAESQKGTGLFGKPSPVRGKPRYLGLVLTALLLLALALVAAWSSFSQSQTEADPGSMPADAGLAAAEPALSPSELPSAEDEALADGQDLPPLEETATVEAATPTEAPAPQDTVTEAAPQTGLTDETLVASATPGNDPQDEIFLSANDTAPATSDPVLLPLLAAATDPPPQLGAPPPPFGTVYTFDANGRIEPTPEGIITPEGVLLVAGRPRQVPPLRPSGQAAESTPPGEPALAAAPTTNSILKTFQADPALAGKKPRNRPAGLVAEPAPDQQGETSSPAPGSRFADIRPQQRPAALTQPSGGADGAAAAASLATTGLVEGNALSLVSSRKPLPRPDGMDQAVDAAVAAALQSSEADPQAEGQTANLAPEEEEEPEVERVAPDIPTSASVAKQATDKNALNLSRVALIGIFGNSAGRYAMIRQPNGSIKRVQVGDQIDGGRVAAISATELQYQKGGRMVTLTLPKG